MVRRSARVASANLQKSGPKPVTILRAARVGTTETRPRTLSSGWVPRAEAAARSCRRHGRYFWWCCWWKKYPSRNALCVIAALYADSVASQKEGLLLLGGPSGG
ncbi:hypothetical protein MRX96_036899 [Rhipicephalus microplus]